MGELVAAGEDVTVADMEAGLEHLSRGTPRHVDTLLAVMEPYFKSLETGRRAYELGGELGVKQLFVLANKVRSPRDEEAICTFCDRHGLRLIGVIPFDDAFAEADREGVAPVDYRQDAPGVAAIMRLAYVLAQA
jgi:CO dehydrogenase maturation factor